MFAIYEFLRDEKSMEPDPEIEETVDVSDPNPVIARRAESGGSPIARRTLDVFLSAYGAEAGDLALTLFATGGVYVGGGIARKILLRIQDGTFIDAFLDKGRFRPLMEKIPVYVVLNEDVEIIGAARCAAKM
jgi:glucokinase